MNNRAGETCRKQGRLVGTPTRPDQSKPHLNYAEFIGAWDAAFERVKGLREGDELGDWKVIEVHTEPNWIWLRRKKEKRMVRRGDQLLVELVASTFG